LWDAPVPELRHLRVFVAVAQERNFARAAERLHLAQQAVSKSIAGRERELGVELLTRTSREVRLTQAGRALLGDAREILAAADDAFARAREHGRGRAGAIAIGATPAVGTALLQDLTVALRRDAPGLAVALREVRPREAPAVLRERRADVVLARTARDAQGLEVVELEPTPAALVVPAGHRLASAEAVALGDLDGERRLTWSPAGTPFTDLLTGRVRAAAAAVEPVESSVTGGGALVDVAALHAVALVPVGWPTTPDTRLVSLRGDVTLPLVAIREPGPPTPAVARLLGLLGERE
jgi:DNA-binding transcriptional LysR family regulator